MVSFLGLENKLFLFYPISSMLAFSCVAVVASCKRTAVGLLAGRSFGICPHWGAPFLPQAGAGSILPEFGRGEQLAPNNSWTKSSSQNKTASRH